MPIVYGVINKYKYKTQVWDRFPEWEDSSKYPVISVAEHLTAFSFAEIAIERQMRSYPRDEICMLVCEDTDLVKDAVKKAHAVSRAQESADRDTLLKFFPPEEDVGLPLTKIVDTPHFAAKADSKLLQVADVCAFLTMRRLNRRQDSQRFFEIIAPQLFWRSVDFGEPMGAERIGTGPRH